MSVKGGPNIVTSGLVLELDAGNIKSYQSGSTTWFDKSGFANNGTLTNGPTFNTGSGGSIVFDGVDDYISTPSSPSLDITESISMEIVFKTPSISVTERLIIKEASGGTTYGYGYQLARYSSDRILATYNNGNSRIFLYSNTKASDFFSQYTHVVYSYNGTDSQKIWINGVDESSGTSQFTSNFTAGSTLGTDLNLMRRGGEYAECTVSYIRLYNKGLSASEVLQNYNALKSRFGL